MQENSFEKYKTIYNEALKSLGKDPSKCSLLFVNDASGPEAYSTHNTTCLDKDRFEKSTHEKKNKTLIHEAWHVGNNDYLKRVCFFSSNLLTGITTSLRLFTHREIFGKKPGLPTVLMLFSSVMGLFWGEKYLILHQENRAKQYTKKKINQMYKSSM